MSALGSFNAQLLRFFKELNETFPEERDIQLAVEAIEATKKINPKMILDLFWENVYVDLNEAIKREDDEFVISNAKSKIINKYNEISPALLIFEKHWPTMTDANHAAIWNYLKVLCILAEKARASKVLF